MSHVTTGADSCTSDVHTLLETVKPLKDAVMAQSREAASDIMSSTEIIEKEATASLRGLAEEKVKVLDSTQTAAEQFSQSGKAWRQSLEESEELLSKWERNSSERLSTSIEHAQNEQKVFVDLGNQESERSSEVDSVQSMLQVQCTRIASLVKALNAQTQDLHTHEMAIDDTATSIISSSENLIEGACSATKATRES